MKNYLQNIRLAFSRELARHLAARLGEREVAVGKTLQGMVPMVLCQLVIQASEGNGHELFEPMVQADRTGMNDFRNLTEILVLLGGGLDHSAALDAGEGLLVQLFGPGRSEPEGLLREYGGLRPDSILLLLRLVAAVVMAGLAQHAARQQLTARRLGEELGTLKNQIYNWLPADLPRWPGFRRRTAVSAPRAGWARPCWALALVAAGAVVLALLVLRPPARPATRQGQNTEMLAADHRAGRMLAAGLVDSATKCAEAGVPTLPATW